MPQYVPAGELYDWMRASGVPDEVSDASLGFHIQSAMSRYSRLRPMLVSYPLAVVSGTQDYEIPNTFAQEEGEDTLKTLRVATCIYAPSGLSQFPSLYGLPGNWWRVGVGEFFVFDQPSIGHIWFADFRHMSEMFGGQWEEIEKGDGKSYIRLMPTPLATFTLPVLVQVLRPDSRIREDDRHIFQLCVLLETCRAMATGFGPALSVSDTGYSVDYGSGVEHYADMAERIENELAALAGNFACIKRAG